MGPNFEMAALDRASLVYEMDRLQGPYPERVFRDAGWSVAADDEARIFAEMQEKVAAKERAKATKAGADATE